jgi:hypothetical protein
MAVSAARVTVSTTAVALNTNDTGGSRLLIKNTDVTNAVDLGTSTVTAGTGFPLAAGVTVELDVDPGEVVSAIRSAGADVVLAVFRS